MMLSLVIKVLFKSNCLSCGHCPVITGMVVIYWDNPVSCPRWLERRVCVGSGCVILFGLFGPRHRRKSRPRAYSESFWRVVLGEDSSDWGVIDERSYTMGLTDGYIAVKMWKVCSERFFLGGRMGQESAKEWHSSEERWCWKVILKKLVISSVVHQITGFSCVPNIDQFSIGNNMLQKNFIAVSTD